MGINIIFICHFSGPDLKIEIFLGKEGAAEESDVYFEMRIKASAAK